MAKSFFLVGPSATGKTAVLNKLKDDFSIRDMDTIINCNKEYTLEEAEKVISEIIKNSTKVIATSVSKPFIQKVGEIKTNKDLLKKDNSVVVIYLQTASKDKHLERLNMMPSVGKMRPPSAIAHAGETLKTLDPLFRTIADHIILVDDLSVDQVADLVRKIIITQPSQVKDKEQQVQTLTKEKYLRKTKEIEGKHWASAGSRWKYHELAANWVGKLNIENPKKVLEMGTMGVSIVEGSETMDYDTSLNNRDWEITGFRPTFVHDARSLPWPFVDKQYELLISLRVFHHLVPVQAECFREARRISQNIILVVPDTSVHPRGIDRNSMIEWNDGADPIEEYRFDGQLGHCYLF